MRYSNGVSARRNGQYLKLHQHWTGTRVAINPEWQYDATTATMFKSKKEAKNILAAIAGALDERTSISDWRFMNMPVNAIPTDGVTVANGWH
jgi:hypothetical protein